MLAAFSAEREFGSMQRMRQNLRAGMHVTCERRDLARSWRPAMSERVPMSS
jgi:hypothetical protein